MITRGWRQSRRSVAWTGTYEGGPVMVPAQNPLQSPLGWRARLGLIIPQLDFVSEPLFPRVLPEGVAVHTARMRRLGPISAASLEQMNANMDAAIELLPTPYIDATVYHCSLCNDPAAPEKLKQAITKK